MLAAVLATSMYALDLTIASVALPHMRGTFSSTTDQISWVLTSYIVASAVATPCTGWLAGKFGRRQVYMVGIVGFTVTSMMCGSASSLEMEVISRTMQGAFAAVLLPLSQAIVMDIYPPEMHGKALSMWGMGLLAGPVMGPYIGGILTESVGWRWVFFINLPLGLLVIACVLGFMPDTNREERRFDWTGFFALAVAMAAVQIMLDRGERRDWFESPEIILEGVLAVTALYIFLVHCTTSKEPFLNLKLLQDRNYSMGLVLVTVFGLMQLAPLILMPPMLQDLRDFPVETIGLLIAPRGLGLFLSMTIAGRLVGKVDARILISFGYLVVTVGSLYMGYWNLDVGIWDLAWPGIIHGIGSGFIWIPLSAVTFSTLPVASRNEATSVFHLARALGSSIGISITVTMLTRMTTTARAGLTEHITLYNELMTYPAFRGLWTFDNLNGMAMFEAELNRQASMIGYTNDYRLVMLMTLFAIPVTFLLGKPPAPPKAVK